MEKITINNNEYELAKDEFGVFTNDLIEKITDYFEPFDYIFGDYSYGKVRFKGFYDSKSKQVKELNDIKNLDNYINNYCSFGCKWFLLKKKNK